MKVLSADLLQILNVCGFGAVHLAHKRQISYLRGYLYDMRAKTAVIEEDYIDRGYLEDYSTYYSRCARYDSRFCFRVHFFQKDYSRTDIEKIITGENSAGVAECEESYIGFVVLRPLPDSVLGRTCLRTYGGVPQRQYRALREVCVSFFGLPLRIQCMPFQEQDRAVAACATCALWAAFQVTAEKFGHAVYSPSRITEFSTEHGLSLARKLPNHCLSSSDMVYAIRKIGLDPLYIALPKVGVDYRRSVLLGNLYAYLYAGIPVVLLVEKFPKDEFSNCGHALVVNGYCAPSSSQSNGLTAECITKIYANDDQLGPYVRIKFGSDDSLEVNWADENQMVQKNVFLPVGLLIPLYHKIRVSYDDIWGTAYALEKMLKSFSRFGRAAKLCWDIHLQTICGFKDKIRQDGRLSRKVKLGLLISGYPKYMWEVSVSWDNTQSAVFYIDATDSGQGLSVVVALFYTQDVVERVKQVYDDVTAVAANPLCGACMEAVKET